MTRGLLFALGILLAVAQAWAIDVYIDEPQAAPIKLKYQDGGVQVTFHGEISGLGDHTYKYWWTWEGGSTGATTFTEDPHYVSHTHTFTEPGEHYMALEATEDGVDVPGDSKDVWVLKLEITSPDGNPSTDNHFVFDTAAHPNGQCVVHATGTTHVASEDPNMWWFIGWISGSTTTSDPDPAEGAEVEFTYTTLPSANSEFGVKELHLKHLMFESDMVMTPVEIFFPRDATNHPGGGTPNWYYYWSQTAASYGTHSYAPGTSYTDFLGGSWIARIGDDACGNWGGYDGIDFFAYVCRHEARHQQDFSTLWGAGTDRDNQRDPDRDWLPTISPVTGATESSLGMPFHPPTGYDPTLAASVPDHFGYGTAWRDCEDYCMHRQVPWTAGTADSEDWTYLGHQWGQ